MYVASGPTVTDASYLLKADTGLTQQFMMTDVTPAETYWFKVLAVNLVGSGPLSDGVSRIAASAPSAPVDLAMIQQSTTSITFSWVKNGNNGGSSVTDYAVYWNQGSGNVQYEVIGSNGLLPTEATIQSPILLADKSYLFWVKARNAVGFSAYSASIQIHSASLPGAPSSIRRLSTTSQTMIVVGWSPNTQSDYGGTQLTGYEVWWNQGPILNSFVKYSDVNQATFSQTISSVTTSANYQFYVLAKNVVGTSVPSDVLEVWAAVVPSAPTSVQRLDGSNT